MLTSIKPNEYSPAASHYFFRRYCGSAEVGKVEGYATKCLEIQLKSYIIFSWRMTES